MIRRAYPYIRLPNTVATDVTKKISKKNIPAITAIRRDRGVNCSGKRAGPLLFLFIPLPLCHRAGKCSCKDPNLYLRDTHFESRPVQHLFSQRFFLLLHTRFELCIIMGLCHGHILPEPCLLITRGHPSLFFDII